MPDEAKYVPAGQEIQTVEDNPPKTPYQVGASMQIYAGEEFNWKVRRRK